MFVLSILRVTGIMIISKVLIVEIAFSIPNFLAVHQPSLKNDRNQFLRAVAFCF